MSNLLVMGGFTESKRLLEPVADEAVKQGFGHDAAVLTLREIVKMSDKRLRRLMAGASVLTHSASIFGVPDARKRISDRDLPSDLVVMAGPEPRPVRTLAGSAIEKTLGHLFGETEHRRRAHLRVVASNTAEAVAHPIVTTSLVPGISRFSTMEQLCTGQAAASGRQGNFMMTNDEFYKNPFWRQFAAFDYLQSHGWVVGEIPGAHDDLLIDPAGALRAIRATYEAADEYR